MMRFRLLWLGVGVAMALGTLVAAGRPLGALLIQAGIRLQQLGTPHLYQVRLVPVLEHDAALRAQVTRIVDDVATERVVALIGDGAVRRGGK